MIKTKKTRKIFFLLFLFLVFFALGSAIKSFAGQTENVVGWIWGGSEDANLGSVNGLAVEPFNETGVYDISMNNVKADGTLIDPGATKSYGVNIPLGDGNLSGYAWSPTLGYISFNEADQAGCPTAPCNARRVGNNLAGWARIIDIKEAAAIDNSGGWQGFIQLDGVSISGSRLSGYGWNGEEEGYGDVYAKGLGWIDFGASMIVLPPLDAPTNLTATTVSCSRISLAWEDNSENEFGFKIERKTRARGSWQQVDIVGEGVTSYLNVGLGQDVDYYFRVRAYNDQTNSDYSNEVGSSTYLCPSVDLKLNGKDSTQDIEYDSTGTLTWSVNNAVSCAASGDWSGSKNPTGGTELVSSITKDSNFILTCTGSEGDIAVDSVSANVTIKPLWREIFPW
ncbi:MAG: fibronectin type III domain-containing protein [Candidatus Portnoybacteria bacterium]|nr:fibronectin type III domain-containing protein [Candidatus Portnoybacteria bacterium]